MKAMLILGAILTVAAACLLAGAVWLAGRADGSAAAHAGLVLELSLFFLTVAPFALIAGIYGLVLQCDEECGASGGWRGDPNAWQWQVQGLLAIGGVLVALAALVAGLLRRHRSALRLLAGSVAMLVTWGLMYPFPD